MRDPSSATVPYSYEVEPRAPHLGGGWRLRLFQNGVEVTSAVYPIDRDVSDRQTALDAARADALRDGEAWIRSGDSLSASNDATYAPAATTDTKTWIGSGNA